MYARQIDGVWREVVGNTVFSPTVFQTPESLTDEQRAEYGLYLIVEMPRPDLTSTQQLGDPSYQINGTTVERTYPASELPAEEAAAIFDAAKAAKRQQINEWRAQANQTHFTHQGKQIACDALSRSDIDAVAGSIALIGAFPAGFPGAWKAIDNTYLMLPSIDSFKAMYSSMTLQGTINFARSQTLKAQIDAATTVAQVNALTWE